MCLFLVQLDSGQFQEQSQEYQRWKEWRDKVAGELRQSVSLGRRLLPLIQWKLNFVKDLIPRPLESDIHWHRWLEPR